jgi:DMSO/TMAO reductase YedYZ molybdopterin-dependent catalytic subunit
VNPTRRLVLKAATAGAALAAGGLTARVSRAALPAGAIETGLLESLPGKQPLVKRSYRPPNYETPVEHFNEVITPNDRFFVRWHLPTIPVIDAATWRLRVDGEAVDRELVLSLEQLRTEFDPVELVAVCQCSGNRRGLSEPHVPGVQWGYGAMGNARWKGARLKDILARAGLRAEAVEIAVNGADASPLEATPPFVKSIPAWKAADESVLVAYEMNGAPLPHWNGFPARLIVPGWTATYWMKQLTTIRALKAPLRSFWMSTAYRLPRGKFPQIDRFVSQESDTSTPITEAVVNTLITNIAEGGRCELGHPTVIKGVAWDGGYGIRRVDVSVDGGRSWVAAGLGEDLGRFSFRTWQFALTPTARGRITVSARATNARGETQTEELIWNPPGYHNNVIQTIALEVV